MRRLVLLAIVLGTAASSDASAQALAASNGAALAPSPNMALNMAPNIALGLTPDLTQLAAAAYAPGFGPVRWSSSQAVLGRPAAGGPVDTLRVSVIRTLRTPTPVQADAYEVSVIRAWPGAVRFDTPAFNLDLSPHAGVGVVSGGGGSAEAGATLKLSRGTDAATVERLKAMGVRDGAAFGDRGRWYLFAAASGRAVGMNMLHGAQGWDRAGWTTDATSSLMSDAQVGVGWRKGDLQTSFGYVRRQMRSAQAVWGQDARQDSMVAFSLSIKPGR